MRNRRYDALVSESLGPLVRWGSVFCGAVIALALSLLVGSLWVALAFGSHQSVFYDHLAAWFAGTAVGAMVVAALVASGSSGRRGVMAGLLTGLTTWSVVALGALAAGVPAVSAYGSTRPITVNGVRVAVVTVRPWTTFWALLIGLGAAIIGGFIGGLLRRAPRGARPVDIPPAELASSPMVRPADRPVPAPAPVTQPVG